MIAGLLRLIVLRFFGARVLLALGVLGWVRNRLRRRPPRDVLELERTGPGRAGS